MFIEALFTIAKIWKQPKFSWKKKKKKEDVGYVYRAEYYSPIKRNEILPRAAM